MRDKPEAVFLLSSPRSGSTLLRVMLAGHPSLFCPPELNLLPFETMASREQGLGPCQAEECRATGCDQREGLLRALVELGERPPTMAELSVADMYRWLQRQIHPRVLVDKSPLNAARLDSLARAERLFPGARYVYLYRHPYAVMESLVRSRFDLQVGMPAKDPGLFADVAWARTNGNILSFLSEIDPARQHHLRYEYLVREPEPAMAALCEFLALPFDPALLQPYQGRRMTDGLREHSPALGDPGFLKHSGIDASLGEVWRRVRPPRPLGDDSRRLAARLGYELV